MQIVSRRSVAICLEASRAKSITSPLSMALPSHKEVGAIRSTGCGPVSTPTNPTCIYGMTKEAGMRLCQMYRVTHGVHATAGILYNHESVLRRPGFVSRKILDGVVRARRGERAPLVLANLDDRVDWSSASDVVRAIVAMVRCDRAGDYVVASGELHSIRDFVSIAFDEAGLSWEEHVRIDGSVAVSRRPALVGDASLLQRTTGWSPSVTFEEMVRGLVRSVLHDDGG